MIRRIFNTIPALLCALFLFASCDKEQFDTGKELGGGEKIRFEISVGTATATPSEQSSGGAPQTRVATDFTKHTSTFQSGDIVGLYIVKGNGGLQASGNWVDNLPMTYNGTGWTYTLPAGKEHYPKDGDELHFYAYYPYNAALASPLNISFAVQADQTSRNNFNKSHLLKAVITDVYPSNNPVQLTFSHLLTLVELKVIEGNALWEKMNSNVLTTIEGCKTQLTVNLGTGVTTASGTATSIKMFRKEQFYEPDYLTSYTYRALVPAQTAAANADLFRFAQGTRNIMSHKPASPVVLGAGATKPYNITLNATLDPDHAYAVGDPYPHKGIPIGVVYEIRNDGKNGKIVSQDEISNKSWGPKEEITSATNEDNGLINMRTIYVHNSNSFSNYPALLWVHEKNPAGTDYSSDAGVWYLPAINELESMYPVFSSIQTSLSNLGASSMSSYLGYWSSTEPTDFTNMAKCYFFYEFIGSDVKDDNRNSLTRAVMAF